MYVELQEAVEQLLAAAGVGHVGSALSGGRRPLPAVEPWIAKNSPPDPRVCPLGSPGSPRKIFIGVKVTVASKSFEDGEAQLQGLALLEQVETVLKGWVMPFVGIIAPDKYRLDSPQLVQEESGVESFRSEGDGVWTTLFSCHVYVDKFEVK